ncbi:hypothetical protein [Limnothrix sp. FACHB-881]|nr:hypothetical protein [Limnothrix sp. FACHB-881]
MNTVPQAIRANWRSGCIDPERLTRLPIAVTADRPCGSLRCSLC